MPSITERFNAWRGPKKAAKEKKYSDSLQLFRDYLNSFQVDADAIAKINADFSSAKAAHYVELDRFSGRSFGALLSCKFATEDALEKISLSEERKRVTQLNHILSSLYEAPSINTQKKVDDLVESIKQFLKLKPEEHSDKVQAQAMTRALYVTLKIIDVTLNGFKKWKLDAASYQYRVDLSAFKNQLFLLVQEAAHKMATLKRDAEVVLANHSLEDSSKSIQDYFNDRYMAVFNGPGSEKTKLHFLNGVMETVSQDIHVLIAARTKKSQIQVEIDQINELLKLVQNNNQKYYTDLIAGNKTYQNLLTTSSGATKDKLLRNIAQIGIGTTEKVLYGISWATTYIAAAYRAVAPSRLQAKIVALSPETIDSVCKKGLNDLVQERLTALNEQLKTTDQLLSAVVTKISGDNKSLHKLITNESSDNLALLSKTTLETKKVIQDYAHLYSDLKEKQAHLHEVKNFHADLDEFIKKYDDWVVRASNLFAQWIPWLKTKTAQAVDEAKSLQNSLVDFKEQYTKSISQELKRLEDNPNLSKEIKGKLTHEFQEENSKSVIQIKSTSSSKKSARQELDERFTIFRRNTETIQKGTIEEDLPSGPALDH